MRVSGAERNRASRRAGAAGRLAWAGPLICVLLLGSLVAPAPARAGTAPAPAHAGTAPAPTRAGGPAQAPITAAGGPAQAPTTALTSSGDGEQWTIIPVPLGGWVALLDADSSPVTATTFRGQGTYTLDPATGQISFHPRAAFYGTARAAIFQVTDATGQVSTGTYQATVVPRPIPAIRAADRTLTSADTSVARIGCTAGPVPLSRCQVTLSAVVNGEQVTLGSGVADAGTPGQVGTVNVDLALTDRGRRLAGAPGGWPAEVTAAIWLPGATEALQVTGSTRLTALNVTAPRPIRYVAGEVTIPDADLPYLNALRARMAGVTTVTCTGSSDAGQPTALDRAQRVCAYLTANTKARPVVLGADLPADNHTEIVFGYQPL